MARRRAMPKGLKIQIFGAFLIGIALFDALFAAKLGGRFDGFDVFLLFAGLVLLGRGAQLRRGPRKRGENDV
ncbi:MAG: hypothetical protein QF754_17965 [Alphaproteobacteria bacterium]|jgi:hypothetical protein|nr:hypothetical protein [Alphaproteobacteria bacterium]